MGWKGNIRNGLWQGCEWSKVICHQPYIRLDVWGPLGFVINIGLQHNKANIITITNITTNQLDTKTRILAPKEEKENFFTEVQMGFKEMLFLSFNSVCAY